MKYIDTQSLSNSLREVYKRYPTKESLFAIIEILVYWMDYLDVEIKNHDFDSDQWTALFDEFDERLVEYLAATDGAQTKEDLDRYVYGPLFEGKYPNDMDLKNPPTWPDVQTPWRLTNDLTAFGDVDDPKKHLVAALNISQVSLEQDKAEASEEEKGFLDDAQKYIEDIKKDIEDYLTEQKKKEMAKKAKPWLLAGLGALAAVALVKSRSSSDGA